MIRKPKFEIGDVVVVKFSDEQRYGTITNCQYSNDPSRSTWMYNIGTPYDYPEANITLVRKWNGEYPQPKEHQNTPFNTLKQVYCGQHSMTHFFKINDEEGDDQLKLGYESGICFIRIKGEICDHRNGDIRAEDCEFYLSFYERYKDLVEQILSILQFAKRMGYYAFIGISRNLYSADDAGIVFINVNETLNIDDATIRCRLKCGSFILGASSDDILNTILYSND